MAISLVQSIVAQDNSANVLLTLPAPSTPGNLLVYWQFERHDPPSPPVGWTIHPVGGVREQPTGWHGALFYKTSTGEQSVQTICPPSANRGCLLEWSGVATAPATSAALSDASTGPAVSVGALVVPSAALIVGGYLARQDVATSASYAPGAGVTERDDGSVNSDPLINPTGCTLYRIEALGGSYLLDAVFSQAAKPYGGAALAFSGAGSGGFAGEPGGGLW